jgi:uncharacterized membrane protein YhhN
MPGTVPAGRSGSRTLRRSAAIGLLAVVGALHLVAQLLGTDALAGSTQPLLMPALVLVLWSRTEPPRRRLVRLTLLALGLSWLGDTVPRVAPESVSFQVMVGCFLLAQVLYATAFWPYRRRSLLAHPVLTVPYLAAAGAIIALCGPGAGTLLPLIAVYAVAIVAMAVLATGLGRRAACGAAVFVLSDSLIALEAFGVLELPAQGFWVMSTYLLAQLLIVLAVGDTTGSRRTRTAPSR